MFQSSLSNTINELQMKHLLRPYTVMFTTHSTIRHAMQRNYYYRLDLLGPKRSSGGRLGRPPPLLLDDALYGVGYLKPELPPIRWMSQNATVG